VVNRQRRLAHLNRAAGAVLLAPITSLLLSRLLAHTVGSVGLAATLPVGLHTYVPGVDLVDLRWLELAALLLAAPGLVLLRGAGGGRRPARAALELGGLLVLGQLLMYVVQAVLVAQVQGLPDTPSAALIALVLPAGLTLVVTLAISFASVLAAIVTRAVRVQPGPACPIQRLGWTCSAAARAFRILDAPLRGPPALPIVDRG
jgi:hypothetical protein